MINIKEGIDPEISSFLTKNKYKQSGRYHVRYANKITPGITVFGEAGIEYHFGDNITAHFVISAHTIDSSIRLFTNSAVDIINSIFTKYITDDFRSDIITRPVNAQNKKAFSDKRGEPADVREESAISIDIKADLTLNLVKKIVPVQEAFLLDAEILFSSYRGYVGGSSSLSNLKKVLASFPFKGSVARKAVNLKRR